MTHAVGGLPHYADLVTAKHRTVSCRCSVDKDTAGPEGLQLVRQGRPCEQMQTPEPIGIVQVRPARVPADNLGTIRRPEAASAVSRCWGHQVSRVCCVRTEPFPPSVTGDHFMLCSIRPIAAARCLPPANV